jgi:hypothetical protein
MVQVQICIDYNVDLKKPQMIPGAFRGKLVINTAHGERHELYEFKGTGGIEEAQAMALAWVCGNMLEYDNPSCRPLRYLRVDEQ